MEEIVQDLEKKWAQVQDSALKQPMPGIHIIYFVAILHEFLIILCGCVCIHNHLNAQHT